VDARIYAAAVPSIKEAWEFAAGNVVPGGTLNNLEYVADTVDWDPSISRAAQLILCDAQTSGGLLISVPSAHKDQLLARLHQNGSAAAAHIGDFIGKGAGRISVLSSG
jgi:selenide,water dikinase